MNFLLTAVNTILLVSLVAHQRGWTWQNLKTKLKGAVKTDSARGSR